MRGLVRLLFMFGPMIFREVQKYQRRKERKQYQNGNQGQPTSPQQPRRRKQVQPVPPPPRKPELSEDEKNFKLEEDDFMLDESILENYEGVAPDPEMNSEDLPADTIEEYLEEGKNQSDSEVDEEDVLDLKNVFFSKEEDSDDNEESNTSA